MFSGLQIYRRSLCTYIAHGH